MCNSTIFEVRHSNSKSIPHLLVAMYKYIKKGNKIFLEINQLALLHKPSCERLICCRYAGLRNLLGINPLSTKIFNINEEILTGLIYQKRFWHQQCFIFEQVGGTSGFVWFQSCIQQTWNPGRFLPSSTKPNLQVYWLAELLYFH